MKLVVGLGNPEPKYSKTRHNLGFRLIDELAKRHAGEGPETLCNGAVRRTSVGGSDCLLVRPLTYVNDSGQCVRSLMQLKDCSREELIVACDDLVLPLGAIRVRRSGSSGGQKGLASVEQCLESRDYARLRMGIGPKPEQVSARDFVLSCFEEREDEAVRQMIQTAADAVETWMREGIEACMNSYNRPLPAEEPTDRPNGSVLGDKA